MYGLPADFDAAFFISKELEQVCFSQNQMSLHFADDITVTIEGAFSYDSPNHEFQSEMEEPPVSHSSIMQSLGHRVVIASGDSDGTLTLQFDHGATLECHDNSKTFDSYHIRHGERVITA